MPHLTQRLDVDFEVAQGYTAGDVDTQQGWAIMAGGSATMRLFVIADTSIEGAQCLAMRTADAGALIGYEKSTVSARVSATDHWRITLGGFIASTADIGDELRVSFSAGAGNTNAEPLTGNTALVIRLARSETAGKVRGDVWGLDTEDGILGDIADLDQKFTLTVDLPPGEEFSMAVDADGDGQGWVGAYSGTIVAGKGAISRVQVIAETATTGNDLLRCDILRIVKVDTLTKVDFDVTQRKRMAKVDTTVAATVVNGVATVQVLIYDEMTGELVNTRPAMLPVEVFQPGTAGLKAMDSALQRALDDFDHESRVEQFVASGYEVML